MKKTFLFVLGLVLAVGLQARQVNLAKASAGTLQLKTNDTVYGSLPVGTMTKVTIKNGAKVVLNGINIDPDFIDDKNYRWAGIECEGDATIVLADGSSNQVTSYFDRMPGIWIHSPYTLRIQGKGKLSAYCNNAPKEWGWAAGIGAARSAKSGDYKLDGSCGTIILDGGKIYAYGGAKAAAVGGAWGSTCDGVKVTPNVDILHAEQTAKENEYGPYVIGAGEESTCEYVKMNGKDYVDAATEKYGVVDNDRAFTYKAWTGDLSALTTSNKDVRDGSTITGTLTKACRIVIPTGYTVYLQDAVISVGSVSFNDKEYAGLTCEGNATIVLKGTNNHVGTFGPYYPGIYVPKDKTLIIKGTGSLEVFGGDYAAAIGGGKSSDTPCGNIILKGGTITATGGDYAPSIGGGYFSDCGSITIENTVTKVTAWKGSNATYSVGKGKNGSCGTIVVGGKSYVNGIKDDPFIYPTSEGIDELGDGELKTSEKVLIDGHVYIRVGDRLFTLQGTEVK